MTMSWLSLGIGAGLGTVLGILGDWQIQARLIPDSFRFAKVRDDCTFVLINRIKSAQQTIAKQKSKNAGHYADDYLHGWRYIKKLQPLRKTE